MTAHAAARLGGGWAFGVREALDAGGAVIGPLIVTGDTLLTDDNYRRAFALLAIPAALCLTSLVVTWRIFPNPADLDRGLVDMKTKKSRFPLSFWLYLLAMSFIAIGYARLAPHRITFQHPPNRPTESHPESLRRWDGFRSRRIAHFGKVIRSFRLEHRRRRDNPDGSIRSPRIPRWRTADRDPGYHCLGSRYGRSGVRRQGSHHVDGTSR